MNDDTIRTILGSKPAIEILLLFESNRDAMLSMTDLKKKIGKSHVTTRNAVRKLVNAKILDILQFGTVKVIVLSDTTEARTVMSAVRSIRDNVPISRRLEENLNTMKVNYHHGRRNNG